MFFFRWLNHYDLKLTICYKTKVSSKSGLPDFYEAVYTLYYPGFILKSNPDLIGKKTESIQW